ncbi:hypothetical protein [Sinorhizobium fredii]|uniref:Amino acid ABC transporter permease n=1 Tax=Rhizobium fredii TaxID=380 RepID=A0A2L0HBM8_RHIFR|nr:hypothetical protein [Sinorhizobium fredii]AUX78900.1 hypothetical protein NXT3_PB00241 [Sinorhizobium fredii]
MLVATLLILSQIVPPLLRWAVLDATFTGEASGCTRDGACWTFVEAKLRFILIAFYPPDLQWRPTLVILLLAAVLTARALPRFWGRPLLVAWPLAILACWMLNAGHFHIDAGPLEPIGWTAGNTLRMGRLLCRPNASRRAAGTGAPLLARGLVPSPFSISNSCAARRWSLSSTSAS